MGSWGNSFRKMPCLFGPSVCQWKLCEHVRKNMRKLPAIFFKRTSSRQVTGKPLLTTVLQPRGTSPDCLQSALRGSQSAQDPPQTKNKLAMRGDMSQYGFEPRTCGFPFSISLNYPEKGIVEATRNHLSPGYSLHLAVKPQSTWKLPGTVEFLLPKQPAF